MFSLLRRLHRLQCKTCREVDWGAYWMRPNLPWNQRRPMEVVEPPVPLRVEKL